MPKRPISVTILSWILIAAGTMGLIYHAREIKTLHPFPYDALLVGFVRVLAIVSGAFMLRAHNWARWLAIVWIAFHVVISYFHSWSEVAMHAVILVVFAYLLLRPAANSYFRASN
jgi:hypothetical protein